MPNPPKGMVWKLTFDPIHDSATLWLYKAGRFTGRNTGWSVLCRSVHLPRDPMWRSLDPSEATVDELVEGVIVTANEMRSEMSAEPLRRAQFDAKANEVAKRLNIAVEVES
jgi:hypothetical protein